MRWTTDQLQAIQAEGNLIVSAAAGAGKTAVLTERIVSRVQTGVPIDALLVLTFTRAAANEMKTRIAARLNDLADREENTEQMHYLRRQARNVDGSFISTIHAFCARVLRRHYHAVGLPAQSRTADEMESAALMETVRDELLTKLSIEENVDYRVLLSAFGSEQAAWDAVMTAFRFTRAQPDPDGWLDAAAGNYGDEDALMRLLNDAVVFSKHEFSLVIDTVQAAKQTLSPDSAKVISVLDDDLTRYRALLLCKNYDEYREALSSIEYAVMRFPKGTADVEKQPIKDARQTGKDLKKAQTERFYCPQAEALERLRRSGEAVRALVNIVKQFEQAYAKDKRDANLQDYDDLEHLTLEALGHDAIAKEYRERFLWIAVDEYQDSNRVQEAILQRIARKDNLFFVGDVKQSIYRFRQAEPRLFLEKLNLFSGDSGQRIDLKSNFRSSEEVLSAVNETFSCILSTESGEIEYDERAKLVCGGTPPSGGAELHLLKKERADFGEDEDALEDAADMEVEGRFIAERIHSMMERDMYTDGKSGETRRFHYSDFAVLLRTGMDAQVLSQTLSQNGIPSYAQSSGGYFDAVEVQIFRNLLRIIDNRRQDIPLVSVLCSSIGAFTFEELATIRAAHKDGSFFEAFSAYTERADMLGSRARMFFEKLDAYRDESRLLSVEELIGKLLDETGFYEEMGAGFGGAQRQANLNALLDKAHAFEQSGARGVWNFLRQIDLAENTASIGAAHTVTADVVRILTIHKSKGLEFPVAFVAGLGKRFNLQDVRNALQLHAESGIALRFIDRGGDGKPMMKRDTIARQIISQRAKIEQLGEEMRVLYVAMTRAKQRLIMTACVNKPEEKLETAPRNPTPWNVLKCSMPVSWLMMGPHRSLPITVHERETYLSGEANVEHRELPAAGWEELQAIEERLNWKYEFSDAMKLSAKAAVSRIGHEATDKPVFSEPAFLGKKQSAVFAGTATHAAMQYLPTVAEWGSGEIASYLSGLVQSGKLTQEQADVVDVGAVEWFLHASLFERMKSSMRLERELTFSYAVNASILYEIDSEERVLLQGVMDACFLENGEWVIVDYKTDRVRPGESAQQAAQKHKKQLELYALALQDLTKTNVKECVVVLLSHHEAVAI